MSSNFFIDFQKFYTNYSYILETILPPRPQSLTSYYIPKSYDYMKKFDLKENLNISC